MIVLVKICWILLVDMYFFLALGKLCTRLEAVVFDVQGQARGYGFDVQGLVFRTMAQWFDKMLWIVIGYHWPPPHTCESTMQYNTLICSLDTFTQYCQAT